MLTDRTSWIVHVDVDAFFASIEQLLIPSLRHRPVIVGSGCIASCSYEARALGLRAGMPLHEARRRCPQAVVLAGQYQVYRCFAEHIWDICRRYCISLETLLDEAYGQLAIPVRHDGPAGAVEKVAWASRPPAPWAGSVARPSRPCKMTGFQGQDGPETHGQDAHATKMPLFSAGPERIGRALQQQVLDEVHLPVSVGLAANRMMAKLAAAAAKPGGVRVIPPGTEAAYLAPLPVRTLLGVGPKLADKLTEMNVTTIGRLAAISPAALRAMFGRRGEVIHQRALGRDVKKLRPDAPPKTISRETTFHAPTCDRDEIAAMLCYLLQRAMRAMRQHRLLVGCVEVSIRYDDWKQQATRHALPEPADTDDDVLPSVWRMLDKLYRRRVALRHVGVVLSNFHPAAAAGRLFAPPRRQRREDLQHAIDAVRDRFGHGSVIAGRAIDLLGRLDQNDYGFVLRTPSLTK